MQMKLILIFNLAKEAKAPRLFRHLVWGPPRRQDAKTPRIFKESNW